MKQLILILLIGLTSYPLFAQDIIVKRTGEEIKAKVLEINTETIKYKEFDFLEGPIFNIAITEVFMIIYENGKREHFSNSEEEPFKQEEYYSPQEAEVQKPTPPTNAYKGDYFMVGTGLGTSYGGLGVRLQWRRGGNQGFGFHAGVGYDGQSPFLFSGGLKYFMYRGLYVNAQFGSVGYEDATGIGTNGRTLYGPSFLGGGDFVWGKDIGFGFNGALGLTYLMNSNQYLMSIAIDMGFIIRF